MTKQEFIKIAKKEKNWNIYSISVKKDSDGLKKISIQYSIQLSQNTVSTEKNKVFYEKDLNECTKFLYN